jgi:hypothetical protein
MPAETVETLMAEYGHAAAPPFLNGGEFTPVVSGSQSFTSASPSNQRSLPSAAFLVVNRSQAQEPGERFLRALDLVQPG